MTKQDVKVEERNKRGKRLLIYGMFALVLVTFVAVLLTVYTFSSAIPGGFGLALQIALIVTVIAIVASVIVWFIYTKAILKE